MLTIPYVLQAQRVSISTDPIRWATLSPNAGVEVMLSNHISADFTLSLNTMDDIYGESLRVKHISLNPEVRYWFRQTQFGHYVGGGFQFMTYDVATTKKGAKGLLTLINFSYGYSFILDRHWNLTPYIGGGVGLNRSAYLDGTTTGWSDRKFGLFPTQVGVTFTYILH